MFRMLNLVYISQSNDFEIYLINIKEEEKKPFFIEIYFEINL